MSTTRVPSDLNDTEALPPVAVTPEGGVKGGAVVDLDLAEADAHPGDGGVARQREAVGGFHHPRALLTGEAEPLGQAQRRNRPDDLAGQDHHCPDRDFPGVPRETRLGQRLGHEPLVLAGHRLIVVETGTVMKATHRPDRMVCPVVKGPSVPTCCQ